MPSAVAPALTALAICRAYDAGGASSAINAAIWTSEKVRASSPMRSSWLFRELSGEVLERGAGLRLLLAEQVHSAV